MSRVGFSAALSGNGERLARVSSANNIDSLKCRSVFEATDVGVPFNIWPMFFEDCRSIRVDFDLPFRFKSSGSFEPKFNSSDSSKA